jgi:hypothetical protein
MMLVFCAVGLKRKDFFTIAIDCLSKGMFFSSGCFEVVALLVWQLLYVEPISLRLLIAGNSLFGAGNLSVEFLRDELLSLRLWSFFLSLPS